MAIGGGAAAIHAISKSSALLGAANLGRELVGKSDLVAPLLASVNPMKGGSKWLKWGGIAAAITGLGITMMGFGAKGKQDGAKAKEAEILPQVQAFSQQAEAIVTQQNTKIATLEQQLAAAQAAVPTGGGTVAPGDAGTTTPGATGTPGATTGTGTTTGGTAPADGTATNPQTQLPTPATVNADGTAVVQPSTAYIELPTATNVSQPTPAVGATPAMWAPGALISAQVGLPAGNTAAGGMVSAAGSFTIDRVVGAAEGYATVDEANKAVRATMNTTFGGSSFVRSLVVEHGDRFYAAVAKPSQPNETSNPISADKHGTMVAWNSLNHLDGVGWVAYSWSQQAGASTYNIPYNQDMVFPGGVPSATATGTGAAPAATGTTTPATTTTPAVAGGGAVTPAATAFVPTSIVGQSFAINASSTAEGTLARGGSLQIQRFVDSSTGGFGTADEAALAARAARTEAGGGDQWIRFLTAQGSDGRYYVYQGSIVARPTTELAAASPMHVFGAGFAEYYDSTTSSWKAVADTTAAAK